MFKQSSFDSVAEVLARTFSQREYAAPEPPSSTFTLRPKWDAPEHAWYLSHVHCALVCTDRVIALRAYAQACKAHKEACGPYEHDALRWAQNRIEQFVTTPIVAPQVKQSDKQVLAALHDRLSTLETDHHKIDQCRCTVAMLWADSASEVHS